MPFLPSKTTYVRPLRENNDNTDHHRMFVSPMSNKIQQFEASENGNLIGFNGEVNLKNMDEMKKIYLEDLNSIHSKLFAGVEEIQKWKTSIEMESKQKNKKIEEILQTLEVQRKTILNLQLENENLSYQLSEEIQQRSFVLEKVHSTKELCSALKKHYNILQGHYEYRNKIEEGFNIADAKRLSAIENLQNEFERVCRAHSEKVGYLNDALASETNKVLNLKETLEKQMTIFENEKESLCKVIESQHLEIQNNSIEIDEERKKFKLLIEEKNAQVHKLEGLIAMHSSNLKELEQTLRVIQNEKQGLEQELSSEKTKYDNYQMEFNHSLEIAMLQETELKQKISVLNETILSLEGKIHNIETEMDEEKQRNELLMSSISIIEKEKGNLESTISEAKDELVSYEQLKKEFRALEEQASEFSVKEKYFNATFKKMNEELQQYKSEKERDFALSNEKEESLKKMIQDYQAKIIVAEEKLKSVEESNSDLLHKVAVLEKNVSTKTDELFFRDEKILNLESAVNSCQEQLECLRCENITLKDKNEAEKDAVCSECEQLAIELKKMTNLTITLQKAEEALKDQKAENREIMKMLNDAEESYNNDRLAKEKDIMKFQGQVHRLEHEMMIMNVKVEEFNTLQVLNQKQKDEIEELKLSATKLEEKFNELKSENEKLKGNLENLRYFPDSEKCLNGNKENITESIQLQNQKNCFEVNKNKKLKVSAKKKNRKTDTTKIPLQILRDNDIDSTSSGATDLGKNASNTPKTKVKDDSAAMIPPDLSSKKNENPSSYLEKNAWEVDSSGSEYLELTYDKDSKTFMGLTPQKSPSSSAKLNSSTGTKFSTFNSRLDNQCVNADNHVKKFGLPLKKNKTESGSEVWAQPTRTPEKNIDFLRVKENSQMKNTAVFNTPSTPATKRKVLSNTSTPSNQRKFFKTPLSDRDNKFKKNTSQMAWSDFLKSSK